MKKYVKPAINVETYCLSTNFMDDVSIDIDSDGTTVPGTSAWSQRHKDIIIDEDNEQGDFGW